MPANRGINVPVDPNCIWQDYRGSTVQEFFVTEAERDARVSQLQSLGRTCVPSFVANDHRNKMYNRFSVTWTEPRGGEVNAIRTSS